MTFRKKQIGDMAVVSRGGPSGKLSISGLRSEKFAQEVPRVKYRAERGLCPALPVPENNFKDQPSDHITWVALR